MSYHSISCTPILTGNLFSDRFNQIDKIFSTLTGEKPISDLPDYDFIQINDNEYQLILLVPGYHEKALDISIQNNQLTVSGNNNYNKDKDKKIKYLHKSIKNHYFTISFNLNNPIKINKAILKLGLLKINFEYEIPEQEKIKKISIQQK
ncbi:Small heat shock protein Ibp [Buchnera aphidicola (Phyllaphis fagi)]|uniref:Hsp20 family protein n=1 Tax=Buchnera aphidicola TaxID=9 RepID=UPI003463D670